MYALSFNFTRKKFKMRVHLREIVLYNFKSFHGEVTIGPFMPFTAIVGPNGAGKSNIMDAISFVVGEKTSALRVRRLNDLISHNFNGSPVANSSHVTAIFDVEGKNKKFTRCIRNSYSEYKIDNQVVEFELYIHELTSLGLNIKTKSFLIFQGSIESICLANPKEISTMLDELSKSAGLKSEYERLKKEMYNIDLDLNYMVQKKKLILSEMRSLRLQQKDAAEYDLLQSEYFTKKTELELFKLFHISKELKKLHLLLNDNRQQMCEYENKKNGIEISLDQQKCRYDDLTHEEEIIESSLTTIEQQFAHSNEQFINAKEKVSHLQRKILLLQESATKAQLANETHKKSIADLQNELAKIEQLKVNLEESISSQLKSQGSSKELEIAQVQEYCVLKGRVRRECVYYIKHLSKLKYKQEINQNKLDNENRKKQEIENKKTILLLKIDQMEQKIKRLEQYVADTEATFIKQTELKYSLETEVKQDKITVEETQEKLDRITKELSDIKVDKLAIPRENENLSIINTLKNLFPDVYGRLSTLCKPNHEKYNIAVTKVLWKYKNAIIVKTEKVAKQCICYLKEQRIGIETFLPLDSLQIKPLSRNLQDDLRNMKDLKNVELLYNVIEYFPKDIFNAILFVTNNTLLCETAEDAQRLAYEMSLNNRYACIALDGTYCQKSGIISGGSFELSIKAAKWNDKHIQELKLQKENLKKKLMEASKYTRKQSELTTINSEILSLSNKLKYSRTELKNTKKEMISLKTKNENLDQQLILISHNIESIQKTMDTVHKEIEDTQNEIYKIEDTIFTTFCKNINVVNIREYEKCGLRKHNEHKERKAELENQYDCIKNTLDLEILRNTEDEVRKYETAIQSLKKELRKAILEESAIASDIEQYKNKLDNLKCTHANIKMQIAQIEREIAQCRYQIGAIAKLFWETRRKHTAITMTIKQKVTESNSIINNSKMKGIKIPMLSGNTSHTGRSSLLSDNDVLSSIDFSYLPLELQVNNNEQFKNIKDYLEKNVKTLEKKLEFMSAPNLKAEENMVLIHNKLSTINETLKEIRKTAHIAKEHFTRVKEERINKFMQCFDYLSLHIDEIYKYLHNNASAQAILVPHNQEEPYLDGINYSCIVPGKCFHFLSSLSGGEKVLAILTLLFTMQRYEAAPFIILDEIDAALDKINIKNVVNFIQSNTDLMHFIIISLKRELFVNADGLIGVSSREEEEFLESSVFTLSLKPYRLNK